MRHNVQKDMDSEQELLHGAHQLDWQALADIYDRYSPGIYRYAYRILGEVDLAEDCVAETFSRFLEILSRGRGPTDHLQAYLYRVAHNWITDQFRRQPLPDIELDPEHPDVNQNDPAGLLAQNQQRMQLRLALQRLTPDQRQVIALKYLEEWSTDEIARAINKPVGATKALLHRGLAALRRHLKSEIEEI